MARRLIKVAIIGASASIGLTLLALGVERTEYGSAKQILMIAGAIVLLGVAAVKFGRFIAETLYF